MAVSHGANGIVFGALHHNSLDLKVMRHLTKVAHNHNLITTCHRAFDAIHNSSEALEILIDLGVSRVLTSGTPWNSNQSVVDGISHLKRIIQQANNRIEIVMGGGLKIENVEWVLNQLPTHEARLTVHAYSTVLQNGITNTNAVRKLVSRVAIFDNQQGER
jgi:copper homeostasis protein